MKRLLIEQSDDEFYTSHSGLALAGACINRHSDLGRQVGRLSRGNGQIADIDILRSYLGLLCLGKSDFQAITSMRDDDFFQQALVYLAARLISTGRRLILRFSRHCPVFAAFQGVYEQLVSAR